MVVDPEGFILDVVRVRWVGHVGGVEKRVENVQNFRRIRAEAQAGLLEQVACQLLGVGRMAGRELSIRQVESRPEPAVGPRTQPGTRLSKKLLGSLGITARGTARMLLQQRYGVVVEEFRVDLFDLPQKPLESPLRLLPLAVSVERIRLGEVCAKEDRIIARQRLSPLFDGGCGKGGGLSAALNGREVDECRRIRLAVGDAGEL